MLKIVYLLLTAFLCSTGAVVHDYYWRDYIDGRIPEDAILGATGLYIGQMPLNGILPGTIYPDKKIIISECCTGRKQATDGVKILCSRFPENFQWDYVNTSHIKTGATADLVIGGIEGGNTLYIGKVFHEGQWKIGKVYPTSHGLRGLRVWTSSGGLYVASDFQILKYSSAIDVRAFRK